MTSRNHDAGFKNGSCLLSSFRTTLKNSDSITSVADKAIRRVAKFQRYRRQLAGKTELCVNYHALSVTQRATIGQYRPM